VPREKGQLDRIPGEETMSIGAIKRQNLKLKVAAKQPLTQSLTCNFTKTRLRTLRAKRVRDLGNLGTLIPRRLFFQIIYELPISQM
jgi:hypothetical protein